MRILITGGHLTPALAFIDLVQRQHPEDKLIFVGREFSQDALQQKAVERYEVEKRGVTFVAFEAVRLRLPALARWPQTLKRLLSSFQEAKALLRKHKPQVVMSFGGYVAVPFALAASRLGIPVVTHDQTLVGGFAHKLISLIAKKIAVSFAQNTNKLLAHKTVVTGNPLRDGVFSTRHLRPDWLPSKIEQPIILIMGGNQGSKVINEVVARSLPELLSKWAVVHQCGRPTSQEDSKEILARAKSRLPDSLQERYFVQEWLDDSDLFWLYRHAFCAVSRSGANATQELAASGLPAVLIPLPISRHNEQKRNAQWLAQAGGAILLDQAEFETKTLLHALEKLQTFASTMRESLAAIQPPKNAAEKLYQVVAEVVSAA